MKPGEDGRSVGRTLAIQIAACGLLLFVLARATRVPSGAFEAPAREARLEPALAPLAPVVPGAERRPAPEIPRSDPPALDPHRLASRAPDLPRSEREHYRVFLALEPATLERIAPDVLRGDGEACRKVALLRALDARGSPALASSLAYALRELGEGSGPHAVSVAEFAAQELAARADHDALARGLLFDAAFGSQSVRQSSLRARVAAALARSAGEPELQRLALALPGEEDALVAASVTAALATNPEREAVARAFPGISPPPEELAEAGTEPTR